MLEDYFMNSKRDQFVNSACRIVECIMCVVVNCKYFKNNVNLLLYMARWFNHGIATIATEVRVIYSHSRSNATVKISVTHE